VFSSTPTHLSKVISRYNLALSGNGAQPIVFAHGFGCDQSMWRFVAPAFARDHKVVLFDHIGTGGSDRGAFSVRRHGTLGGYAEDVLDICRALDLQDAVFVGHSVSAMIGLLAANREPERFSRLVMVGPSPRYIDDDDYRGGFRRADIYELLELLESNPRGWAERFAPLIMGNPANPAWSRELAESLCHMDPEIALHFARVTFLSDVRAEVPKCQTPVLILQCSDDAIAPVTVGEYLRDALPASAYVLMKATGHCPHLSAPQETITVMREYLQGLHSAVNAAAAG
jgi:sigma-B regulation protein RsbQ